jgi:hypothetical protein
MVHAHCMLDTQSYKAHTFRLCNTHCLSTEKTLHERASMFRYKYTACLIHYCIFLLQARQKRRRILCGFQLPRRAMDWISGTGISPFATTPKPDPEPMWVDIQWITNGIATRYGLGSKPMRVRNFPQPSTPALGLTYPPV